MNKQLEQYKQVVDTETSKDIRLILAEYVKLSIAQTIELKDTDKAIATKLSLLDWIQKIYNARVDTIAILNKLIDSGAKDERENES